MLKQIKNRYALISIISLALGVTTVSAATGVSMLTGPFTQLYQMMRTPSIVYGLAFLLYFMLFYGIYAAALKFVPTFAGDNGLNHQGKVVAIALSGLTLLSLFVFTKGNIMSVMEKLLGPFGVFGGLMLACLFAGITYFGITGANNSSTFAWVATAAAIGMIFAGLILTKDTLMSWGFLILLIALPIALLANRNGGGHDDGAHGDDRGTGRTDIVDPPTPDPRNIRIDNINSGNPIDNSGGPVIGVVVRGRHFDQVTNAFIAVGATGAILFDNSILHFHANSATEATIIIPGIGDLPADTYRLIFNNGSSSNEHWHTFRTTDTRPPIGITITSINNNDPINNMCGGERVELIGTRLNSAVIANSYIEDSTGARIISASTSPSINDLHFSALSTTNAEIDILDVPELRPGTYTLFLVDSTGVSGSHEFTIDHSIPMRFSFEGMVQEYTAPTNGISGANLFFSHDGSINTRSEADGTYILELETTVPFTGILECYAPGYYGESYAFTLTTSSSRIDTMYFSLSSSTIIPTSLPTLPSSLTYW